MEPRTQEILNALNRRFYRRFAGAFDQSRHAPWAGWQRVVEEVAAAAPVLRTGGGLRVLDVGCGNGRFGSLLARHLGAPRLTYLGIDASAELLAAARHRLEGAADAPWAALRLEEHDVLTGDTLEALGEGQTWDLIAVFGLLHHVPGRGQRRELLRTLAGRLAPGGVLAVALWRFGEDPRFARRRLPWEVYNRSVPAAERVDRSTLEDGDWLLRWGASPDGDDDDPALPAVEGAYRYCHAVDLEEEAELVAALEPLAPLSARFDADGRTGKLNRYLLFRG